MTYDGKTAADYAQLRCIWHRLPLADPSCLCLNNAVSRVLELGCGTGNYIYALQSLTGCAAWGLDPSTEMLSEARSHGPDVTWTVRAENTGSAQHSVRRLHFQRGCRSAIIGKTGHAFYRDQLPCRNWNHLHCHRFGRDHSKPNTARSLLAGDHRIENSPLSSDGDSRNRIARSGFCLPQTGSVQCSRPAVATLRRSLKPGAGLCASIVV